MWSDDQRAAWGRPRTEPGAPVEIDPELTPPPQAPPQPADLEVLPLQDQVMALQGSLVRHQEAIGSLWEIRHINARIGRAEAAFTRIEHKVDSYTQSFARIEALVAEFVMPGLKSTMASTDDLLRRQEFDSARLGQLIDAVNGLVKSQHDLTERLRQVESKVDKISDNTQAHAVRLDGVETVAKALDVRVTALELERRDKAVALVERKRIFTTARVVFFGAAAAIGGVTKAVIDWLGK